MLIRGKDLQGLDQEAGGHRIQRVPPTEKRGRVHTSTVTVAVLDPERSLERAFSLHGETHRRSENDFQIEWFSGSGAGGQHRNKHQNCCRVIHLPTGLVETRQGRKRSSNLREAMEALEQRLDAQAEAGVAEDLSRTRRAQRGSGMRGDKTVTIRFQDDRVQHHGTGRSMKASKYMRGYMDELWA